MKKVLKKVCACFGASRTRKAMARMLAVVVVFTTTYSLVLPAITKTVRLSGELDGVSVEVEAMSRVVPEGTELVLAPVLLPEDEAGEEVPASARRLTEEEVQMIKDAALEGDETLEAVILKALDISLNYNGNEIEPNDVVRLFLRSDLIRTANRPAIVHLTDSGEAVLLEARDADGDVILFGENFVDELDEVVVPIGPEEEEEKYLLDGDGNPIRESDRDRYLWNEDGSLMLGEDGKPVLNPEAPAPEEPVTPPEGEVDPEEKPGEGETPAPEEGEGEEPEEKPDPDAGDEDKEETPDPDTGDQDKEETPDPDTGDQDKEETPDPDTGDQDKEETPNPDTSDQDKEETPDPDTGDADKEETPTPDAGDQDKEETPAPDAGEDEGEKHKPEPDGGKNESTTPSEGSTEGDSSDTGSDADSGSSDASDGASSDAGNDSGSSDTSNNDSSSDNGSSSDSSDSGSSDSDSGEASVETDSFSVYAIVGLAPKAEEPPEEFRTFSGSAEDVDVYVTASLAAFPEGTVMEVTPVDTEAVLESVSEVMGEQISVVQAVDISFYGPKGEEIEPAEPISVVMRPREAMDAENSRLVHIGAAEASVVENADFEEEQVSFDSGEFSTYVIVITLGKPGEHVYKGDGVTVTVTYGSDAGLPEGTEMTIEELKEGTEEYAEYFARTQSALNLNTSEIAMENVSLEAQFDYLFGGGSKLLSARFYDITLKFAGQEIEPAAPVNVEIKYDDASAVGEGMKIVHFADEGTEIIGDVKVETGDDGATVSYQQKSFSVTATATDIAKGYGNGGWWYTTSFQGTKTYTLTFRYDYNGSGIFELGYPGNFHTPDGQPKKDNAGWSWPGDPGYPFGNDAGRLIKGTTIEQILKALATVTEDRTGGVEGYWQQCKGVDFIMYGTYTVDDDNWEANGSRNSGAMETEVWTGEYYGSWSTTKPTGWQNKTINIKRAAEFTSGELIHIEGLAGHPIHARTKVIIDNGSSGEDAVLIENQALLMMEDDAKITGSGQVGTGVHLDNGGAAEFFDTSKVEYMAVAVEQENGKLRLKDSVDPFGTNNHNKTGVLLWHGQSIGKWTDKIDGIKQVPIFLKDIELWKSGDIVMDSGRWWYNEKYNGPHNEMYGAVVKEDLGDTKFYFQNETGGVKMGLEYYDGGVKYTSSTVTNLGGNEQKVSPGERYPVIRFTRGTVFNTETNTWYNTLYDAVNNENPITTGTNSERKVQSGDTLVFYGSTVEDRDVVIPSGVTNLTIRTSYKGEMGNDNRSGDACTAEVNARIVIEKDAEVTIKGGGDGRLTLDGGKGDTIVNNGLLNLQNGVTLTGAGTAVEQNGEFHLYEGVTFSGNSVDTRLEHNRYITLETTNPTPTVKVELAETSKLASTC